MKQYIVITADIIESKKIINEKLIYNSLKKLNINMEDLKNQSITRFELSRGDEIQAIFNIESDVPKIIMSMLYSFYPIKLKIGIGIGEVLREDIVNKNSWNSNGVAFYNARKAIDILNKEKRKKSILYLESSNQSLNNYFNSFYSLNLLNYNRWKATQWEAVYYYEKYKNLEKVATRLNVSISAIQQRIASSNWLQIKEAEKIFFNEIRIFFQ